MGQFREKLWLLQASQKLVDGVDYVIDPGSKKEKVSNPRIRVESLIVSPIKELGELGLQKPFPFIWKSLQARYARQYVSGNPEK